MTRALPAVAIAAALWTVVSAQNPQQVFRTGVVFVNVDAYPRRDGRIVEGLTKTDFEIKENGQLQTVETFEFVRVPPFAPDLNLRDPNTVEESLRLARDPRNRVFVIYLDIFHITVAGSYFAREPLLNFLRRSIGPNDLFAVLTPEVPVSRLTFARLGDGLASDLVRYWPWGLDTPTISPRNDVENQLMACGGEGLVRAYRRDTTVESVDSLVAMLGTLRDERKHVIFVTEGLAWGTGRAGGGRVGGVPSRQPGVPAVGVDPLGRLTLGRDPNSSTDRSGCNGQANRFAQTDYGQRFLDLLTAAQRANVAFHPMDVGGLRGDMPDLGGGSATAASMEAQHARNTAIVERLHELAHNTDGMGILRSNDLAGGLSNVIDNLSAYYLLGYQSTNPAADGRFRRIDVRVKQPDVDVTARRGYVALTEAMVKAEAAARAKPTRARSGADDALERLGRIRPDARAFLTAARTASGLEVVVELAGREIEAGRFAAGAPVSVTAASKDDGRSASAEGHIPTGSRSTVVTVPVASTDAPLRVTLRMPGASRNDESIEEGIDVPAAAAGGTTELLVFRAAASPRAALQRAADPVFRRTERVHLEWPVGANVDSHGGRLLNRQGDPLPVPVVMSERLDGGRVVLIADLGLAPLAPADYVIELTASRGDKGQQQWFALRVVR